MRREQPLLDALHALRARVSRLGDREAARLCATVEAEVEQWAKRVNDDLDAAERRATARVTHTLRP